MNLKLSFTPLLGLLLFSSQLAHAMNPIVRPFSSVRAQGMGNVRYTTGLFEENFFANPARITANPENRFQLPQLTLEAGTGALSSISDLINASKNSGNNLSAIAGAAGRPLYSRVQLFFPGYYNNAFITSKWAFGAGFLFSAQTQAQLSQIGVIDPFTMIQMGPAITVARRFLDEDRLAIGTTIHTDFRANINQQISITDYLGGKSINGNTLGGNGIGLDFDLGARFIPHWTWLGFQYELGAGINNILGGYYKSLGRPIKTWKNDPIASYRSYNFGISATKDGVWIFDSLLYALEFTDIGNNVNGSIFRTIHLGGEAQWKVLKARLGANQGYLTAGLGIDLNYFELNFATYGEEMSLNSGGLEDRRYALQFGFQI